MHSPLSPDTVLAQNDPGDEIARRFRYQWTWAAIMCCALLDETQEVAEIFCEHHEDILLKRLDGKFIGLQVKTRDGEQGAWSTSDKAVKKSCARFCELEHLFPGRFSSYHFQTNHQIQRSKNGKDLRFVLGEIRRANGTSTLARPVQSFLNAVAKEAKCDAATARQALQKTEADDRLPKLTDIEMRLISTLTVGNWPRAQELVHASVVRAAQHLANECARASSLAHADVLPAYLPSLSSPADEIKSRIEGKRFDKRRLLSVLEAGLNDELPLNGPPSRLTQPGSGNEDLLLKKLDAGGFSAVSRNSAVDLRDAADYLGVMWTQKLGNERGLQRYSHIRSLVLSDAARAFETAKLEKQPMGLSMLDKLRSRFEMRRAQNAKLYECSDEHLEGVAYSLTSECKIQWSIDRPWEDE